jgi:hypothetical protein
VGGWLHGVARNVARKAAALSRKRRAKEREAGAARQVGAPDVGPAFQELLDQELAGLPENYRAAIVLCDLEGRTLREAARHLGWPQGTVATRLARGRSKLAARLSRRGLALGGAGLAGALPPGAVLASVPAPLVDSTVRAANLFATGPAATGASPTVAALTEGGLKAMRVAKFKVVTAVLMMLAVTAAGALGLCSALGAGPADRPAKKEGPPRDGKEGPGDKGGGPKVGALAAPLRVTVLLEEVDAERGTITAESSRRKAQPTSDGGLRLLKTARLARLPVAKGAKLVQGGKEVKLADLREGRLVILELAAEDGELVVVGVRPADRKARGVGGEKKP